MWSRSILRLGFFTALIVVVAPRTAHAYIDPGTGSVLLQIVLAGLFGFLFTARRFLEGIRSFSARIRRSRSGMESIVVLEAKPNTVDAMDQSNQ
ncbi:hypothetical protein HY480_02405 [Candidatus Uhrbacteria bacterium]|nr:hypothetical protein [Candidatus Uhrbacteria bacterium]